MPVLLSLVLSSLCAIASQGFRVASKEQLGLQEPLSEETNANSPPVVNRALQFNDKYRFALQKQMFKQTCEQKGGQFAGKLTCRCAFGSDGVCLGRDGKIGGAGCRDKDDFEEGGCTGSGTTMECPTCEASPCGRTATLVPIGQMIGHRTDGYACSCEEGKSETHMCFDGDDQPGCPDSIVKDLRWSRGFLPFQCPNCKCSIASSFEKASSAPGPDHLIGDRFIYPQEDLCAARSAQLDMSMSERLGIATCNCVDPSSRCLGTKLVDAFGAHLWEGCSSATSFEPVRHPQNKCQDILCHNPGAPESHAGPVRRIRDSSSVGVSEGELFHLGDKVQWSCAPGYRIVKAGAYSLKTKTSTECIMGSGGGVFQHVAPQCGSLTSLLQPAQRYNTIKKSLHSYPDQRQYILSANGPDMTVQIFKRANETIPRTVETEPIQLKCVDNNNGLVPDFGEGYVWKTGITCSGVFNYKHKRGTFSFWAKEDSEVVLHVVIGQNADRVVSAAELQIAARETWPEDESSREPGRWMEVVPAGEN